MEPIREDIGELLQEYIQKEKQLLANDANEQTLSHQLAVMLGSLFRDWDVDCEYNRNRRVIKRLIYAIEPNGDAEERNVVPDIIIHRRMTSDNLIAVEIKKTTNNRSSFKDLEKLRAFKEQLGYRESLFIRFKTGQEEVGIEELQWI